MRLRGGVVSTLGATTELERDFTREYSDRTKDNGFKLEEGRFRLDCL